MDPFFSQLLAPIASAAVAIITPVIVATLMKLFQKAGVDIEAKNREALQSALQNAATIAIAKVGGAPAIGNTINKAAMDMATEYVQKSVPDAIKKFDIGQGKLIDLLQPHMIKADQAAKEANK